MRIIRVTSSQIEQRRRERPAEYFEQLAPAKLRDLPDGGAEYDADHPAWKAAVLRHRRPPAAAPPPATEAALDARREACEACGEFLGYEDTPTDPVAGVVRCQARQCPRKRVAMAAGPCPKGTW